MAALLPANTKDGSIHERERNDAAGAQRGALDAIERPEVVHGREALGRRTG
jgi:hypothetical protein